MIGPALRATLPGGAMGRTVLDLLSRMVGRELRATVERGAVTGELAHIRLAGQLLAARVEGPSLPDGSQVRLRVERLQGNEFRLLLLPDVANTRAGHPPAVEVLLGTFIRRLPIGRADKRSTDALSKLAHSFREQWPEMSLDVLTWEERGQAEAATPSPTPGQPAPAAPAAPPPPGSTTDDPSASGEEDEEHLTLLAWDPHSRCLSLRMEFPETGILVAALLVDPKEGLQLVVRCERPETAAWIRSDQARWKETLAAYGAPVGSFQVLGPDSGGKVEFRA